MDRMNETQKPKRSAWFWILTGCGGFIVLFIIGIALLWHFGTKKLAATIEENAKNPALRAEKAKRMLGAARLPDGYYPVSGTLELPILTHVRLYDRAPDDKGFVTRFTNRGFIFTGTLYTESSKEREAFFTGAPSAPELFDNIGIKLRARENVSSGSIEIGKEKIRYRTVRGRIEEGVNEADGPMVLMWIGCPGEKKERWAVWFQPDAPDEAAIRNFMLQFDLCRAK